MSKYAPTLASKRNLLRFLLLGGICVASLRSAPHLPFEADLQGYLGSKACAGCHSDIAKTYALTPMAQASGAASDLKLPAGQVRAEQAGATYSFRSENGVPRLSYSRVLPNRGDISGSKMLTSYIGSGAHARGFIFEEQGEPFQAPIAYYGAARGWDLAPGYQNEKSILINRKVEPGCLNCHASQLTSSYPRFLEGAVSCERCHGPGDQHVRAVQSGHPSDHFAIVNPATLAAENRDSICAQCHLTGETRVAKPGRSETSFQAGDRLTQHVVPFIKAKPDPAEMKVVGHFEGLWLSKCKRVTGDRLWCGTCHDPHRQVAPAEKLTYYRQKCLGCHQESSCKLTVAARVDKQDACTACHMQQRASTDGQHTAFTDHTISRSPLIPSPSARPSQVSIELKAFWPDEATPRDAALAYADQAWLRQDAASFRLAHEKLKAVIPQTEADPELEAQLAFTYDLGGEPAQAEILYQRALRENPANLLALTNLAIHLAQRRELTDATALWRKALLINPGLVAPGRNLARVEALQGHKESAIQVLRQLLSLNPDADASFP